MSISGGIFLSDPSVLQARLFRLLPPRVWALLPGWLSKSQWTEGTRLALWVCRLLPHPYFRCDTSLESSLCLEFSCLENVSGLISPDIKIPPTPGVRMGPDLAMWCQGRCPGGLNIPFLDVELIFVLPLSVAPLFRDSRCLWFPSLSVAGSAFQGDILVFCCAHPHPMHTEGPPFCVQNNFSDVFQLVVSYLLFSSSLWVYTFLYLYSIYWDFWKEAGTIACVQSVKAF